VSQDRVPDRVFELARARFDEVELVNLTMVIATINVWNRLAVPFRTVPESYGAPAAPPADRNAAP